MIHRRKFLQSSVLGAGSVLFSSALLQSCTKFGIPLPGGNPHPGGGGTPPPLTYEIDWNDAAKTAVVAGLEMIPEAGEIMGPLTDIFWPKSGEDVWGQVKAQTEALVKKQIDDAIYQQVREDLGSLRTSTHPADGLIGAMTNYQNEVSGGTPGEILIQWMNTRTQFVTALPHFQSQGNEFQLLGLFVQFANMYLGLLRDAVISGQSWGRTDANHQQDIQDLKDAIQDFVYYVNALSIVGRQTVVSETQRNDLTNEPFNTVNKFDRQMAFLALDFKDTWKYYDVTLYPNGAKNPDGTPINMITHEIYSDPMGSILYSDKVKPIVIPSPVPTQGPAQLSLWGGKGTNVLGVQVTAVQVTYPVNSGPGGVTQTPRMGAKNGGSNQPPYGAMVNISPNNPVVAVQCTHATYTVDRFQLTFYDGTMINVGGTGDPNRITTANWTFYNEFMSSIYITGASGIAGYTAAACIVFGFKYWQSPTATLNAIRNMYVKSPKEHSIADFAKAFPNLAIPAGLITYELKAARLAYWADIEVRAKEHK